MNKLGSETSPYLLQHASNPVDWYPWGEEALERARKERKPILLSIGYSACHWCHVMAHESFEDPDTANLMNRLFINIKVDREERPDLDKIYQSAHQLIQRRPGGWPLTMFLNYTDQRPYFGGTYFPKDAKHGLPSFGELLRKAADYCRDNQQEIESHGEAVLEAFANLEPGAPVTEDALSNEPLIGVREMLGQQFDETHGGFGSAPKFPHPSNLDRLLRHWRSTAHGAEPDTQALFICSLTLTRMAEGGIYDQLGGGFCRYSVDAQWMIPHFEKMLYDNGPLLALYAQLWQVSGDDLYRRIASETADWVVRDMLSPEGGFYSTLDADSEGEEGRFYVWTPDEIRALLTEDQLKTISVRYGLDQPANFEGQWHLRVAKSIQAVAESCGKPESTAQRLIDEGRARLLATRNARIWPARDEKILTSWNALMIRGLSIASRCLNREELAETAAGGVDFIRSKMIHDNRLLATYKDGRARFNAYLDDYAYLLDAILELLQARWNAGHLRFAVWLAEQLLDNFKDDRYGGFYFTSNDHEALIHRTKPMSDDALPSGNGIAALGLTRLGHLLGETRYIDAAAATLKVGWAGMKEFPYGHTALVTALEETLYPPEIVILRGVATEIEDWSESLAALYSPRRLLLAIPDTETDLPGALATRKPQANPIAYICRGTSCSAPIESLEQLAAGLSESQ
jgi:uncharacterized protein YyaL (SSP411 family)